MDPIVRARQALWDADDIQSTAVDSLHWFTFGVA